MTPDNYRFFDDCRTMFMTDGWRHFQEELLIAINSIHIASLDSAEAFWKAKGRLEALTQIANWEAAVLHAEEQQEDE